MPRRSMNFTTWPPGLNRVWCLCATWFADRTPCQGPSLLWMRTIKAEQNLLPTLQSNCRVWWTIIVTLFVWLLFCFLVELFFVGSFVGGCSFFVLCAVLRLFVADQGPLLWSSSGSTSNWAPAHQGSFQSLERPTSWGSAGERRRKVVVWPGFA